MTGAQGVPTLFLPFEGGRCAAEAFVRQRVRAVRERLEAAGLGRSVQGDETMVDLICRTSPQAGTDTIGPVADWLLWLFPLDDLCEDVFAANDAVDFVPADATGLARHLVATALPLAVTAGMAEFREDVTSRMSPGWGAQFLLDLDSYFLHAIRYAGASSADVP